MNIQRNQGRNLTEVLPVRYVVVSRLGFVSPTRFATAQGAAEYAMRIFPDQSQDEDRAGKGWDIEAVR